jgi:hypothetical protein
MNKYQYLDKLKIPDLKKEVRKILAEKSAYRTEIKKLGLDLIQQGGWEGLMSVVTSYERLEKLLAEKNWLKWYIA